MDSVPSRFAFLLAVLLAACAPFVQPPGTGPGPARLATDSFITADGFSLPLRVWRPDGEPRAVMLAIHGLNDYSNAFALPGPVLAERGILVYAYDQRGFGDTPHRRRWPGPEPLVRDALDAARLLRQRHPGLPLYTLGESMGGAVAMIAAVREPAAMDGVALIAPAVWGRKELGGFMTGALEALAHAIPWYTLTGQGLKITPSDNAAMLADLGADPLVIKQTRIDVLYGVVDLMDAAVAAAPRFTEPALLLYGLNDDIIPKPAVLKTIGKLPAPRAGNWRLAVYDNGYHMLLRDIGRRRVIEDVAAWALDPAAPLPSGADRDAAGRLRAAAKAD